MADIKVVGGNIRVRRDTLANFAGYIPVNGEPIGIIGADGKATAYKIGDGTTDATQLPALSKGDKGDQGAQGLPGTNGVATDNAVGTNVSTPGTATRTALDGRYAAVDKPFTFGQPMFIRGANGEDGVIVKPKGDGHTAAWQLLHNDTAGFVTHIVSGPDMSSAGGPGGLSGWGVGTAGIVGLVVDVSAEATGQQNICFAQVGPLGVAHQVSTLGQAKALKVSQSAADGVTAGTALTVTSENANPNADQKVLELRSVALAGAASEAGATVMSVYAKSGMVELSSPKTKQNGGQFVVTTYDPFQADNRSRTTIKGSSVKVSGETGSGTLMWSHRLTTNGTELQMQSAGAASDGAETWVTNVRMTDGRIGFFGAAPAQRPAAPTDIAGVIAALKTLGLTA